MVPRSLRIWFVVHFYADMLAAVPLFLAPRTVQGWLGWGAIDPLATRLVAAALFGIGIESYLGRNAGLETFRNMLNLKVIWSGAAVIGVAWSQLQGGPVAGWGVLAIFVVFNAAWVTFRLRLAQPSRRSAAS
jgi:hypothetical protein